MRLLNFLLGRPISTDEDEVERVGPFAGVGVLGLDALASAAYGPEALLTALLPLGAASIGYMGMLTAIIIGLLLLLALSYSQTIRAYPNGGGAYTVARENLGTRAALLAAAALSLDYLLNVAVAISAGVGALVSAIPSLLPHTLALCLGVLGLLTLINLRGVRSTGAAVLVPTYSFALSLFGIMIYGAFKAAPVAAAASHVSRASAQPEVMGELALGWLLLKALANGCTAMTGVEAVSNGVPIFKKPSVVGARQTLAMIVLILVGLLVGNAALCHKYGIMATPPGRAGYESILSQLTSAVVGRGPVYYVTMGSVIAVLGLSANTSFADFPRVCRMLAGDKFLPEPFVHRGRRLAFSHGIWVLSACSAILLIAFQGVTDHLIPLFALGALGAFTTSQAGMVAHWRKRTGARASMSLLMNLAGAAATGIMSCIVLISKFTHGAWITIFLVGAMLATFAAVRRHYDFIARATETTATLELGPLERPIAIVPLRRWDAVSLKALRMAVSIASEVYAVQVLTGDREVDDLTERWQELVVSPAERLALSAPRLIVKRSKYRSILGPLLNVVGEIAEKHGGQVVAVVIPELVEPRWYQQLLHGQTAALMRHRLRARGGPRLVIVSTPWYLRDWLPERRWVHSIQRRWGRKQRSAEQRAPGS